MAQPITHFSSMYNYLTATLRERILASIPWPFLKGLGTMLDALCVAWIYKYATIHLVITAHMQEICAYFR